MSAFRSIEMDRNIDLNYVLSKFILNAKIETYGNGHINDTYRTSTKDCILQRINTNVFRKPEEMMDNIFKGFGSR